jgi:hypothetical protein
MWAWRGRVGGADWKGDPVVWEGSYVRSGPAPDSAL